MMRIISKLIGTPPIHPLLFFSGKTAGYILWTMLAASLARPGVQPFHATAVCLTALGAVFILASSVSLGRSVRLGVPGDDEQTEFKSGGVYRVSRNPMYTGFNLLTLAAMLQYRSIPVLLAGAYSIVVYHRIILAEERFLEQRFGTRYAGYRNRVGRYL